MRPDGRMVIHEGAMGESAVCKAQNCNRKPIASSKFWSLSLIGQLQVLAAQPEGYRKLAEGEIRAVEAASKDPPLHCCDCYHGRMLRRARGGAVKPASGSSELAALLRMATDGFKTLEGRKPPRSTWPTTFAILNYDFETRFQAKNCLATPSAPRSRDSACFDAFLQPAIEVLLRLEGGAMEACSDGKQRAMRALAASFAGDMPAVEKALGGSARNAAKSRRFCRFNSQA